MITASLYTSCRAEKKCRIWKLALPCEEFGILEPWCLTTSVGTYRFTSFGGAVAFFNELLTPYERIDGSGNCGGILQ